MNENLHRVLAFCSACRATHKISVNSNGFILAVRPCPVAGVVDINIRGELLGAVTLYKPVRWSREFRASQKKHLTRIQSFTCSY